VHAALLPGSVAAPTRAEAQVAHRSDGWPGRAAGTLLARAVCSWAVGLTRLGCAPQSELRAKARQAMAVLAATGPMAKRLTASRRRARAVRNVCNLIKVTGGSDSSPCPPCAVRACALL
jgi:hypothetical protein